MLSRRRILPLRAPRLSQPSQAADKTKTSYLDLPWEVRHRIHTLLVRSRETIYTNVQQMVDTLEIEAKAPKKQRTSLVLEKVLVLARTCKTLNAEVKHAYYEDNTFAFLNLKDLFDFLRGVGRHYLRWLRVIEVDWNGDNVQETFNLLRLTCPNLRSISLHVSWSTDSLYPFRDHNLLIQPGIQELRRIRGLKPDLEVNIQEILDIWEWRGHENSRIRAIETYDPERLRFTYSHLDNVAAILKADMTKEKEEGMTLRGGKRKAALGDEESHTKRQRNN
jgi:hypothetical protein